MTDVLEITTELVLEPIPTNIPHGWRVYINGEPVPDAQTIELFNPRLGSVFYGLGPTAQGSSDCLLYRQANPRVLIVPFAYLDDELWIGLRHQHFDTLGGDAVCIVGGVVGQESFLTAAKRILDEQTGISTDLFHRVTQLAGRSINPNHELFVTSPERGDQVWVVELQAHCFTKEGPEWQIQAGVTRPGSPPLEWHRWTDAIEKSPDGLGLAAISRLLAHLKNQGRPL